MDEAMVAISIHQYVFCCNTFQVRDSHSPCMMKGTTCHQMGILPPWCAGVYYFQSSFSEFIQQTALAAFGSISLLGLEQTGFPQIPQRPANCRLG